MLQLDGASLTLAQLEEIADERTAVALAAAAAQRVTAARDEVYFTTSQPEQAVVGLNTWDEKQRTERATSYRAS